MIWLVHALNNKVMASFAGHEDEVSLAKFTLCDKSKHIVSTSTDKTIKVWSPLQANCLSTVRGKGDTGKAAFHQANILCMALHHERPLALSGDAEGSVFASQYMTGEVLGRIGKHADSCESIVFSKELPIAVSAGIDTNIYIYDLKDFSIRLTINFGQYGGITKLKFSTNNQNRLIALTTTGELMLIDPRDGKI